MNIKLEQYKVFYYAAMKESFSEAAKQLYITQSAVSQQIRALENELGVMLFARGRKGATLTAHGKLLFSYVQKSLAEIDNAENVFINMKSLDEGNLRIGAGDTLTKHFLLPKLEQFHNQYPGIKIEIVNRVTSEALSKLISGDVDVAFINLPVDKNHFHRVDIKEVGSMEEIFIAGSKYDHLKGKALTIYDIAKLPLVMLEPKSNTRQATDSFFLSHGITLNPEFELGSHDLLLAFAEKNLGIACVTEEFTSLSENVFKLNTDFKIPTRKIGICTLKNTTPNSAVIKLTEMFE